MDSMQKSVLIVDDDRDNLTSLRLVFEKEKYDVYCETTGKKALDLLRKQRIQVVVTDLMMPGEVDGLGVLRTVQSLDIDCEVVLMTAYGTVETAVQAMKEGAYDFITKPFKRVQVLKTVERAMEKQLLIHENRELRRQLEERASTNEIIGSSINLMKCIDVVGQAAPTEATILLEGESGTGKELFAKAIVARSNRRDKPYVVMNCAALPESILESELFGYERGAFTGAVQRKRGRFESADGGTLFLDEIGDMNFALQGKILRVLQEGTFERLGGNETLSCDVRVIAATNKKLDEEVKKGTFREDLYYRLNVIKITLPPLRDRKGDIAILAQHFLQKFNERNSKNIRGFSHEAMTALSRNPWKGNVRELENTIERAVILCRDDIIEPQLLWDGTPAEAQSARPLEYRIPYGITMSEIEWLVIEKTLEATDGDKKLAAQILGSAARTIYRKLRGQEEED